MSNFIKNLVYTLDRDRILVQILIKLGQNVCFGDF